MHACACSLAAKARAMNQHTPDGIHKTLALTGLAHIERLLDDVVSVRILMQGPSEKYTVCGVHMKTARTNTNERQRVRRQITKTKRARDPGLNLLLLGCTLRYS